MRHFITPSPREEPAGKGSESGVGNKRDGINGFSKDTPRAPVLSAASGSRPWICLVLATCAFLPALHGQESVRTLAGAVGIPGHADGAAAAVRFADPVGLIIAAQGRTYIADSATHCIRLRTPDGRVSTFAGQPGDAGDTDSSGGLPRFDSPSGIALDPDGSLVVSDTGNHTLRRVLPDGRVSTLAGQPGDPGITNGPARLARFNAPLGIAIAPDHTVFVADSGNHSIREIRPDGTVSTLAGENGDWGAADGTGARARFYGPVGIALAPDGSLAVADSLNHAVRRVTREGRVTTLAGRLGEDGSADGPAADARFGTPAEICFDPQGRLYMADAFLHTLRRLDPDGMVRTVAGSAGHPGSDNGDNGIGRFFNPYGVAVAPDGTVWVTDTYNEVLREVVAPSMLKAERTVGGISIRLEWESVVGRRYQVLFRDRLGDGWQALGQPLTAAGYSTGWEDAPESVRLYQVQRLD